MKTYYDNVLKEENTALHSQTPEAGMASSSLLLARQMIGLLGSGNHTVSRI